MPVSEYLKSQVREGWSDRVPSGWSHHRIGRVLKRVSRPVTVQDEETYSQPVIRRGHGGLEIRERQKGADILTKRQYLLREHDWLMSKVQILHRAYGIVTAELDGSVASGSYYAFRPTEELDLKYLWYLSHHPGFHRSCELASVGVVIEKMVFRVEDWSRFEFLLPPLPEQKKIAAIVSSLDDAIAATRRVIEQTEQVKKGLLQTLMTRGIGHRRFKKTEIGEVPEDWEVSTVGTEFETQLGKMLSKAARKGPNQIRYVGNAQVQWGHVVLTDLATMHFTPNELAKFSLRPGDLLVCEGGEAGRTAIWEGADFTVSYQKAIHRLRTNGRILPRFMLRYLRLAHENGRLVDYTSRSSIAHLTQEQLRRVPVPVPPRPEQESIIGHLDGVDTVMRRNADDSNHLLTLKRGLLQDLLTGRVRVTPD